jgi:hypothetical protein
VSASLLDLKMEYASVAPALRTSAAAGRRAGMFLMSMPNCN